MILVRDAMVSDVVSVDVETTLKETCRIMSEERIGSLLITRSGKPKEMFTERSLVSKVVLKGVNPEKSRAELGTMSTPLTVMRSDYELKEAARAMAQLRVRRLPVVDDGRLVGMITAADIVKA